MSLDPRTPPSEQQQQQRCDSPRSGTASDVAGIVSATMFKKTVNDSRIVTPAGDKESY